ncbi:MAG: pyridoxal phosphate-dependent aminotransferase [Oscillospiraceae bacterium]|jgi:aspartate aminotransferase|nr:pyridoxal phosphate-dependent aminotransferase [Oscillospiraceae bacterium]
MKPISKIAENIAPSSTLALDAQAKALAETGKPVLSFCAGEPDFPTPRAVKDAAIRAIEENKTKYTPSAGILTLREAICTRLFEDTGVSYKPNQIVVASGAKHSIFIALQAIVNPGDEVALPAPYWVTYAEAVRQAGGTPVFVQTREEDNFLISAKALEAAITAKTKALILNNPSNPTGMMYSEPQLREIADIAQKHDLYVLSDEIYYRLTYGKVPFVSFAALSQDAYDRTITINGVSKSYAMTGWRIGYSASSPKLAAIQSNYLSHSTSAPSTVSQWAAAAALSLPEVQAESEQMREEFLKRRDFAVARVNTINGLSCKTPDGAFYIMINITRQLGRTLGGRKIATADDFCAALLDTALVAAVPGTAFGIDGYVRFSYAAAMDDIEQGLSRIEKFLS